jgi:predicted site-specific integrase-resolvase
MRAAIYARLATADGQQDADNHLAQLGQFAAEQVWEMACEYIERRPVGPRSVPANVC